MFEPVLDLHCRSCVVELVKASPSMSDADIKDMINSWQLDTDRPRLITARDVGNIRKAAGLPPPAPVQQTLKEFMEAHKEWIFCYRPQPRLSEGQVRSLELPLQMLSLTAKPVRQAR